MASVPQPILRSLRNVVAFALALAAMCVAINSRLPSLRVSGISDKLDYLSEHRGQIDTIFIGSSRVYHAFDPAQFDRLTDSTRSFNFGIDGMRPPESFYVLREVLKLRLPLRHVFLELSDFQSKVNAANLGSARYVHWHDWRHTALVLRHIAVVRQPLGLKVSELLAHLECFVARMSNIGRGPEWLGANLRPPSKPFRLPMPWKDHAGFEAQTTPPLAGPARTNYESAVRIIERDGMMKTQTPPLLGSALRDLLEEVRTAKLRPFFVISPTVVGRENLVGLGEEGIDAPVIAFTDPRRQPGVFRAENHCDEQHLNAAGAAEFTRLLAEEFVAQSKP